MINCFRKELNKQALSQQVAFCLPDDVKQTEALSCDNDNDDDDDDDDKKGELSVYIIARLRRK